VVLPLIKRAHRALALALGTGKEKEGEEKKSVYRHGASGRERIREEKGPRETGHASATRKIQPEKTGRALDVLLGWDRTRWSLEPGGVRSTARGKKNGRRAGADTTASATPMRGTETVPTCRVVYGELACKVCICGESSE